jgi:hypothetical protein
MLVIYADKFEQVIQSATMALSVAPIVPVGEWQAIVGDIPQAETIEVEDFSFEVPIPWLVQDLQSDVEPNLPWAEDHFQERVSGVPHNPPPSSSYWPFATQDNQAFKSEEKFSHTYPERIWPKWVVQWPYSDGLEINSGLRYPLGDLDDVIKLLKERPGTRQAYLPIWFPEDTGAVDGQRVPCTLGYHFLIRGNKLKIVYYIRSCDFYRHFRDDVYMAARLAQHVAKEVGVYPDRLVMHISSLHIFSAEKGKIMEARNGISSHDASAQL